ncbi:MAG: phenylacetate--CoA ligase [Dehalococcoidia bacterium]|nr:MAG: phenylacetate--CoA ligase [Dehalococcoidia bacterium]
MSSEPAPEDTLLFWPRERVRALQDRLLRETIVLCWEGHPYYGRLLRECGLTPADFQTTADLVKLPITTKHQFLADPEAFRLRVPAGAPLEAQVLWEVMYTTGTTSGQPAPIYTTTWDHYAYLVHARRCATILGLSERDVVANVFPLAPFPLGAYVRSAHQAAAAGAAIITINPGRPSPHFPVHRSLDDAVRLVAVHRATLIWGIASFVRRLLLRARELGADFSSLRGVSVTGEAVSPALREELRRLLRELGSQEAVVLNRYGSTEMGSMLECVPGSGWHNPSPDQFFYEVVDPERGTRLGNGEVGLLLATHLQRRGTVLLRYALGDLVALTEEVCPHCGRTSERVISQPVRTKELVKIKGTLVNLEALREALEGVPALEEYQIVVQKSDPADPFSLDELLLRLAAPPEQQEAVAAAVSARTLALIHLRPRVEFVPRDVLFDPAVNVKAQRILDRRPPTE